MDAYNKARSGSGQVVGLVGDAGVGKSRLLLELKNQLPQGEFAYLEGQCLHFGNAMAYLPVLDILRSYFKIKEGDQESRIKKYMEENLLSIYKGKVKILLSGLTTDNAAVLGASSLVWSAKDQNLLNKDK